MIDMGIERFRAPGIFGPEIPANAGAPAHRRLLAYLGRIVATAPLVATS